MISFTNLELRRMPITSSNNLPYCSLVLGQGRSGYPLSVLFDTGAALATGLFPLHKKIMTDNPITVHRFEEFNGPKPFNSIKLTGAISNTADYNEGKHSILSVVVRYFIPYSDNNGKHLLFHVAFGNEMAWIPF